MCKTNPIFMNIKVVFLGILHILCVVGCDTKKEPKPEQPGQPQLTPLTLSEVTGTWKLVAASLLSPVPIADIYDTNNTLLISNPSAREGFCSKNSLLSINTNNTCIEEFIAAIYNFPNSTTQNCPAITYTGNFTLNSNNRTITLTFSNPTNDKIYFVKSVENGIMIAESESSQGGIPSKRSITYQKQ